MHSQVKVLLVEDSPSDAALVQESLAQSAVGQFEFTHVETLAEAMREARQTVFDVSLLDLTLPDSTGRETFLRARAEAPALPIVVLTSIDDEGLGLEAVRHGIQDYLVKGQADGRQTAHSIRYAIERKRSEEALKEAEAALQEQRAQLEVKVRERTAELSALNELLQAQVLQRQRAEKAHQAVRLRLAQAQESERGRISREMHDRLGQDLTALKLGIQNLRRQGPFALAVAEDNLSKLENLADGLMRDIHRLAWELRPSMLDDFGLDQALRRYTDAWFQNWGVPVDLHTKGDLGAHHLPQELATTLYRVAQEALTNVARHAHAKRVSVLLERRAGQVSLIVEDDGRGFEAREVTGTPSPATLGLLGIQERVRLAGGTVTIESSPGAGATLFVRLPLHPGGEAAADWPT